MHFRRRLSPSVKADMVPMIDVVFQLVIFFNGIFNVYTYTRISIELPESTTAESVTMTSLVISVVSENEIYLNKEVYTVDTLAEAVSKIPDDEREAITAVVIEGDQNVSYELLVEVLDLLRLNRFKGVNLRMRDIKEE